MKRSGIYSYIVVWFVSIAFLFLNCLIIADEAKQADQIKCNFQDIGRLFDDYKEFFNVEKDWQELEGKYKCEDVLNFIIEKEKERFTLNLKPVTPKEGLSGGYLFAYGKCIEPPYEIKFDYDKKNVMVNNIQIYPKLKYRDMILTDKEKEDNEIRKLREQIRELERRIKKWQKRSYYRQIDKWIKEKGKEYALRRLAGDLNYMKSTFMIRDYKIYDEDKILFDISYWYAERLEIPLKYQYTKEQLERILESDPIQGLEGEELEKYRAEEERKYIDYIQNRLNKYLQDSGTVIIITSSTYGTDTIEKKELKKILEILETDLNDYEKILLVDSVIPNFTYLAQEIVFNYDKKKCNSFLKRLNNETEDNN